MVNKKLMVLVVAYNAEATIKSLLDRMPKEVWKRASEVVIADDASKDFTSIVANEYKLRKKIKNLTIIKHEKNKGYGGNQKWGYNYAIKKNYDMVVMIHGDVQYPPEHIMSLVKPLEEDRADFVFGSRMSGHPLKGGMPIYKYLGNIFLTTVENIILGTRLTEFHSGFRAYSIKALKQIPLDLNSSDFHFDSEIIVQLAIKNKNRIKEVTIPTYYGDEKSNVNVISYGLNVLKVMMEYILNKTGIRSIRKFCIKDDKNK